MGFSEHFNTIQDYNFKKLQEIVTKILSLLLTSIIGILRSLIKNTCKRNFFITYSECF